VAAVATAVAVVVARAAQAVTPAAGVPAAEEVRVTAVAVPERRADFRQSNLTI
jgi:hypothetical protein